jgi:hypothetical protein
MMKSLLASRATILFKIKCFCDGWCEYHALLHVSRVCIYSSLMFCDLKHNDDSDYNSYSWTPVFHLCCMKLELLRFLRDIRNKNFKKKTWRHLNSISKHYITVRKQKIISFSSTQQHIATICQGMHYINWSEWLLSATGWDDVLLSSRPVSWLKPASCVGYCLSVTSSSQDSLIKRHA